MYKTTLLVLADEKASADWCVHKIKIEKQKQKRGGGEEGTQLQLFSNARFAGLNTDILNVRKCQ